MNGCHWSRLLKISASLALLLVLVQVDRLSAAILSPESGAPITLILGDNESPYFKLSTDSSTYVTVSGPGSLTLLVRAGMPVGAATTIRWTLRVTEGTTPVSSTDTTSMGSDATWKESSIRPGEACKIQVPVPEGSHRYQIALVSPVKTFAGIRYLFSSGVTKVAKSAVYPVDMLAATAIAFKEKVIDFFLADTVRAVKVKVIGPTQLRIVTRLAYAGVMKGPQKYSAVVDLDSKPANRTPLETTKSPATYFTTRKDWSVGESRTIYLDIPDGTHEVSVRLGSSDAPALAMRFTIPKDDIRK